MKLEEKKEENKIDKKRELISNDLNELLKLLIIFIIVTGIFGYIGYLYSSKNNFDVAHDIIFFSLYPLVIGLIKILKIDNTFVYIISTIAYFYCVLFIPTIVGVIILLSIIAMFIATFIYIEIKDRTEEIKKSYGENKNNNNNKSNTKNLDARIEDIIKRIEENENKNKLECENNSFNIETEVEICECEMCFKKITYEEYELYDGMCEECFCDVHTDEHGHFH